MSRSDVLAGPGRGGLTSTTLMLRIFGAGVLDDSSDGEPGKALSTRAAAPLPSTATPRLWGSSHRRHEIDGVETRMLA
jgi:hypothetical protein